MKQAITMNNKRRLKRGVSIAKAVLITYMAIGLVIVILMSINTAVSELDDLDRYYSRHQDELEEIAERIGTDSEALSVCSIAIDAEYDIAADGISLSGDASDSELSSAVAKYTSADYIDKMSSICKDIQNETGNDSANLSVYYSYAGKLVFHISYYADGYYSVTTM